MGWLIIYRTREVQKQIWYQVKENIYLSYNATPHPVGGMANERNTMEEEEDCMCWEEFGELCDDCAAYAEDQHTQHLIDVWKEQQAGII